MTSGALKITRKGQVTIPKEIRERLGATSIYFEVQGDEVLVKPVRDAGGSLKEFAANATPHRSMKQRRDQAWEEAVREKTGHVSA